MHYEDKKTGFKFDAVSGVPKENTVEAFEELFAAEKEAEKGELPEPPRPQHMRSLCYDGYQMREYARQAIAADRMSRQVEVPEGWALVPIQPSQAMIDAASKDWHCMGKVLKARNVAWMVEEYKAMVEAASSPVKESK